MATTIKIVLRKKPTKDGKYPLSIRITKDRKSSFISIGQKIKESDWDSIQQRVKKSHPNSSRLNIFLLKKIAEANDKLIELETQKALVTSQAIRTSLQPSNNTNSFFNLAENYLNNFRIAGKYNRFHPDQSRLKQFRVFLGGNDISFQEINVPLLEKFKAWLKGKQLASDRSIMNHLIIIRTIFNLAAKGNIIDLYHYPFGKDKIQIKLPGSLKIGLTTEEVKRIEDIKLDYESPIFHSRNLWLFSFYFAGMRVSDVLRLKWSDISNDRLSYQMGKNSKTGTLKINDKAFCILNHYRRSNEKIDGFIFPELQKIKNKQDTFEVQKRISYSVKTINKHLFKLGKLINLDKKLTMHIARHTFGNISGDRISIQMLQKLYRHSSITTTIGYQANFIHKDADEALDSVLDF